MRIFDHVLKIYQKYYICKDCLGRQFSLLGTNTTNRDRGYSLFLSLTMENHRILLSQTEEDRILSITNLKILAENARFEAAQKVLENEGIEYTITKEDETCYLCNDLFKDPKKFVKKAIERVKDLEYQDLLVGTTLNPQIINREDQFKGEFVLLDGESFKSHFNRFIGKKISNLLNKPVNFETPDIVFIYTINSDSFSLDLTIKSLFISGRYNKYIRGIPQTHWICSDCNGKGCEFCNNTGKRYETSVEELITPEFIRESKATSSKFHGAGREDIDVRMLGQGRPFIIELKNPTIRSLNLERIQEQVNNQNEGKIRIQNLEFTNKKKVINLKAESENTRKIYKALVVVKKSFKKEEFDEELKKLKEFIENQKISQRTPHRVSHRRADKVRQKMVYKLEGKYIESQLFEFILDTQGGTYIKELISGDEGRTTPSFAEIFGDINCKELDVMEIKT